MTETLSIHVSLTQLWASFHAFLFSWTCADSVFLMCCNKYLWTLIKVREARVCSVWGVGGSSVFVCAGRFLQSALMVCVQVLAGLWGGISFRREDRGLDLQPLTGITPRLTLLWEPIKTVGPMAQMYYRSRTRQGNMKSDMANTSNKSTLMPHFKWSWLGQFPF